MPIIRHSTLDTEFIKRVECADRLAIWMDACQCPLELWIAERLTNSSTFCAPYTEPRESFTSLNSFCSCLVSGCDLLDSV